MTEEEFREKKARVSERERRARVAMKLILSGREFTAGDIATILDVTPRAAGCLLSNMKKSAGLEARMHPTMYNVWRRAAA